MVSTAYVFIVTGVVGLAIGAFGLWAAITSRNETPSTRDQAKPSQR
jgi:hypothetical protein